MSNNDSYYNKILGESFELAVKNKKLESKEYKLTKENELLKARVKELEEKNNHLVDVNKTLERKLKIAKEVLQYLDNTKTLNDLYLKYRVQQALQKIKEV